MAYHKCKKFLVTAVFDKWVSEEEILVGIWNHLHWYAVLRFPWYIVWVDCLPLEAYLL